MGSLLAAVHPLGPGRLLLLLRACGAVCGLAGASTVAAGFCAVPASAEGVGHLLPNSGSTRGDAAACGLCASLGDIAEASRRALGTAAGRSGTGLERRSGTAGRRSRGTRAPACGPGPFVPRHDGAAHARYGGADGNAGADSPDRSTSHRARTKLWRTGHQAGGDTGAENAQRQQRERGQHHDQRVVDGWFVGMHLELGEQA